MKHFAIAQWVDFVRGLKVPEREIMQRHLAACEQCARVTGVMDRLRSVASRNDIPEVPDYLVRNARAMFALNRPVPVTISSLIARLIYDTNREPLSAGVRSQPTLTRQALYEAGDYCIDLSWDCKKGDQQVGLTGQIVNKQNPDLPTGGLQVVLTAGDSCIAQTNTNANGEFQLQYHPGTRLRLQIPVEGSFIEVSLAEVAKNNAPKHEDREPGTAHSGK